ncbi:MAG: hypothetical protein K0S32_4449 [Bacteroidetes bacterium]|nr:hypothetical protein [Bacteroidota bacterium]
MILLNYKFLSSIQIPDRFNYILLIECDSGLWREVNNFIIVNELV